VVVLMLDGLAYLVVGSSEITAFVSRMIAPEFHSDVRDNVQILYFWSAYLNTNGVYHSYLVLLSSPSGN